jgi:diguanylate cyclase (GGDEF)-like protein
VYRNRKEIFTNDYLAEYTNYKEDPMSNRKGRMSQSILYVPLFIENKIIGTITAQSYNRNAYTKHHLDMLKTLASYTAIAIRNGQESDLLEAEIRRRKTVQDELLVLNEQLIEMTYIDALTQIPNRRHFTDSLETELSRSIRDNQPLGLLLIDIDKFKEYNDNYGHTAGDTCLHAVAQILKSSLKRKTDFVARYGGDEFIAILPGTDYNGAIQVAEDMRKNVQLAQIEHKYSTVSPIISITLGIYSEVPDRGTSLERVVQLADQALYTAKDMGRNCVAANISPISFDNKI